MGDREQPFDEPQPSALIFVEPSLENDRARRSGKRDNPCARLTGGTGPRRRATRSRLPSDT